jgi:lipoprotein-anchoring transpeptidase ErfK/SrfK
MKNTTILFFILVFLVSCGASKPFNLSEPGSKFLSSGSIVLSRQISESVIAPTVASSGEAKYSPILGYIPPMTGILPAANEIWLEIDSGTKTMTLIKGEQRIKSVPMQGEVPLSPGKYALQYKQHFPTWYAPDSYFEKRHLQVPNEQDQSRYLKGALGEYALYPTSTVVIHSSPLWSDEIGGLRVKKNEIAEVFSQLSLGSSIVVK